MMEPKIRFKGFEGEWKAPQFSEMVERISASGQAGMLPGVEFEDIVSGEGCFNKNIYQKECHKYGKLFYEGDILFGKLRPYLKNIILADFNGVAIGDFWVLRSKGFDEKYLYTLVNSESFLKVANISSGSKMPRADWNLVSTTKFVVPSAKDEQKAIGKFFTSLDSQISASTSRLASLKQMKAASLQAMFPQEGETVPKIRFKGFDTPYKQSLVGDICHISTGKSNTQDKKEDGVYPFYVRSPHIEKSNKFLYDEEAVLTVGDGVGTGKVFHYVNGKYDLHQRVYRMFNFKDINAKYFYYLFSQKFYKRVMSMTAKSSVDSVRLDMISKMMIETPSIAEQQAIASYFTSLDRQISLQSQRLEKLKQIKSACLDKMFV